MTTQKKKGKLSIIGIGPGDPELMTVKAVRALEKADVIITPKARKGGNSTALHIASGLVDLSSKKVQQLHFPMHKVRLGEQHKDEEVQAAWQHAAETILSYLDQGLEVAFPTLGDPALYSTGFYVRHTLKSIRPEATVVIIPGITAMASCSATAGLPIGLGDDLVTIVPAAFEDDRLRQILITADSIVLMKVHRVMPRIISLLEELNLIDKAILFERCGQEGEQIYTDIREAETPHYFSTILIRKQEL
jgi:precorrin-2/cobalt-factor-2 C20-methyltransferase